MSRHNRIDGSDADIGDIRERHIMVSRKMKMKKRVSKKWPREKGKNQNQKPV